MMVCSAVFSVCTVHSATLEATAAVVEPCIVHSTTPDATASAAVQRASRRNGVFVRRQSNVM